MYAYNEVFKPYDIDDVYVQVHYHAFKKPLANIEFCIRSILFDNTPDDVFDKLSQLVSKMRNQLLDDPISYDILKIINKYKCFWHDHFKDEDIETLEYNGITMSMLRELADSIASLQSLLIFGADINKSSPFESIYFNAMYDAIYEKINKIEVLLGQAPKKAKTVKNMISHYITDENENGNEDEDENENEDEDVHYLVPNPYKLLPDTLEELKQDLDSIFESDLDMGKLNYSPKFRFLSTFLNDIKKKNINDDEFRILKHNFYLFLSKGVMYSQIYIKPTATDISNIKNKDEHTPWWCHFKSASEEIISLIIKYQNAEKLFFRRKDFNIQKEEIQDIYQRHQNDEIGQLLRPIIEDLIPYIKSFESNKGLLHLTKEVTKEMNPFFRMQRNREKKVYKFLQQVDSKYQRKKKEALFVLNNYIGCLYLSAIDVVLYHPPDETYLTLVKQCLNRFYWESWSTLMTYETREAVPSFNSGMILNHELSPQNIEAENDLQKQKYYMVYLLMQRINRDKEVSDRMSISWVNSMILILLPWKFDSDSEDANSLRSMIMDSITSTMDAWLAEAIQLRREEKKRKERENEGLFLSTERKSPSFSYWINIGKFVRQDVVNAQTPFPIDTIHSVFSPDSYYDDDDDEDEASCCNIH